MTANDPYRCHKPSVKILDEDQVRQIHMAALGVLERTGVRITHDKILELLDAAGANVDGNRVRFPPEVVEAAIRTSPSHFIMGRRDGEPEILLEDNNSWFGAGLDSPGYLDPVTDKRRPFTSKDCRVMAAIANALPNYAWAMTLGLASDVPANIAERLVAKQALTHCEKPLFFCSKEPESVRDIYDMAVLIAGSRKRFRQAPSIAAISSATSPLSYDDGTLEKIIFCAEKGIPQVLYPALQAGATSPATFAGTIVQASAESLCGLVIAQLIRKGTLVIFGAFTTIMDMGTTIFSYGAIEMNLMTAAMSQMAQHYQLPFFGTAGCSDAKFHDDPQAVIEATFSCLSSALSGASFVHDSGLLDHSEITSPNYLVLIDEILSIVNRYMRGIVVNKETLALDLIDRVGPGGNYLAEEHTMRHFRDVWYSELIDRTHYDAWLKQGSKGFTDRLQGKTKKIMDCQPTPLPTKIIDEIDRMEKQWYRDAGY